MDISSHSSYPAGTLSNFAPQPFELDGVIATIMEISNTLTFSTKNEKYTYKLIERSLTHERNQNNFIKRTNICYILR